MNIYNNPENYGLEIFLTLEADLSYEFDMLVVWKRVADGKLFYKRDSGCSCPAPFEDCGINDLHELRPEEFELFEMALRSPPYSRDGIPPADMKNVLCIPFYPLNERMRAVEKIKDYLPLSADGLKK